MSCIVAYNNGDYIYFGSDSIATSNDYSQEVFKDSKIFIKNEMLIGYCGSIRAGQIIKYDFNIPFHPEGFSDMEYFCCLFFPKLLEKFNNREFFYYEDNKSEDINNNNNKTPPLLIGYKKKLYLIGEDFQIIESSKNYSCIGSASDYALGAFSLIERLNINISPEEKIYTVLDSVSDLSYVIKPPYNILKI